MPIKSKNGEFPLRLVLPAQQVDRVFRDAAALTDFLTAERDHWQQQNQPAGIALPGGHGTVSFLNPLTAAIFAESLGIQANPVDALTLLETKGAIVSDGIYGRHLAAIRVEKPKLYAGAVAAVAVNLAPQNSWPNNAQHQLSIAQWFSGLGGVLELLSQAVSLKAERDVLNEAIAVAQGHKAETEEMKLDFRGWQDISRKEVAQEIAAYRQSITDALRAVQAQLAQTLQDSVNRTADLEEKVRNRLILEAPTTYWSTKADTHIKIASAFGAVFLSALMFGVYWLTHDGVELVAKAHERIVGNIQDPGLLALVPLAFITLPTLAFAWFLRHVSRVIVQNLALGADARLRGTIATTYSALTAEQDATPAELAIVFNALFRPVDGSTHQEIAPPNLADLMEMAKK